MILTPDQHEELDALRQFNDVLKTPSAIHVSHWEDNEPIYKALCEAGLVRKTRPPRGWSRLRYFGARITSAGRAILSETQDTEWSDDDGRCSD